MPEVMDEGMQVLYSIGSYMKQVDKKHCFHDVVFVLRHKYVPAHKKQLAILGERRKNLGE
jgi:hypothetical protein